MDWQHRVRYCTTRAESSWVPPPPPGLLAMNHMRTLQRAPTKQIAPIIFSRLTAWCVL